MTLKAKIGVAGFVHVQLAACDENGGPIAGVELFDGGAGADIDKIQKIKDEPADFDAFWDAQLKALDKTAPELIEAKEVASSKSDFTVYAVKIRFSPDNTWGNYAVGYLSIPKNAEPGTLALFMQSTVPVCMSLPRSARADGLPFVFPLTVWSWDNPHPTTMI